MPTLEHVEILRRRHARERYARETAESLLEQKSAELFQSNEALRKLNERLEQLVADRTVELVEARDNALQAARVKSKFLANMSHEIRTPLNGVLGMLELLGETGLSAGQRELAETAQQAGASLLVIINDILDFSKIEAGRVRLEAIDFEPRELLERVVSLFAPTAQAKSLTLSYGMTAGLPRALRGDPTRIQQVLSNLIGNALKFTQRGGVDLRVEANLVGQADVRVQFIVTDSGIGIAPGVLPGLFQPFTQADDSTTRKFGGTGLGLAICKRLVELMEGEIGAESEPGQGSRFKVTLTLPLGDQRQAPVQASVAPASASFRGRVLLAEDNPVNSKLAIRHLEALGLEVDTADNGRAAVALATAHRFDLMIMDCQMPDMDGLEATEAIRAHEAATGRPRTPIIALTASVLSGDRERCLSAGMDDYLGKPYGRGELAEVLGRWLSRSPNHESAPPLKQEEPPVGSSWDSGAALNRAGGDTEFLAELVALFLAHLPPQLQALDKAVADADIGAVERIAHYLAGTAANLSADEAADAARELLARARAGHEAGVSTVWATAKDRFTLLEALLTKWLAPQRKSEAVTKADARE